MNRNSADKLLWTTAALSLLAIPAPHVSASEQPIQLDEVVVVATPIIEGNSVDRYAASSTVVSEEQIDDLNAVDLGTALRRTPGVNISRYNPIGSFGGSEGGGIFIRGMGASRPGGEIKTFIDGVPMYMSVWNHPLLDLLSIDSADSLHVYKSAQPHVFGNAFAAVNIDTKRKRSEGFESTANLAGGSYGTFIEQVEHGGKSGPFDYYLGQSFRSSNGHRDNSDGELTNYFARLGMDLGSHWNASVFGLHTDNFANDPGVEGKESTTRNGKYVTNAMMGIATLSHSYEKADGFFKAFINQGEGDWTGQRAPSKDSVQEFDFHGLRAQEKVRLWGGGEVTVGMDWDAITGKVDATSAKGVDTAWDGPTQRIFSPYLAASQLLGSQEGFHCIPSAGVRYYNNSEFDEELAPHAGLILGYNKTQLHGGYSRGVLYPGLEVVVVSEFVNPLLKNSWKSLEAETLDHYELGVAHSWDKVKVDLTFFEDRGENRYLIRMPPPPPPVYANLGDYRTQGAEATVTVTPTEHLALFLGLTLLDSDQEKRPYTPESTVSTGLNWRFLERFTLSLDAQYVSEMYVTSQARNSSVPTNARNDSYFLVNGKLSYELPLEKWGKKAQIYLSGENLGDENYQYLPGYPMPGINGMLGMSLKF